MKIERSALKYSLRRAVTLTHLLALLAAGLIATSIAEAQVPTTVSYQGRLTTSAGVAVANGAYSITFRIYDDSTAGDLYWEETQTVKTKNGLFSVQLGKTTLLDQSTLSIPNLYLAIKIGADPESSPRSKLNAVPYATLVGTVNGASGGQIIGDLWSTGQVSGISSTGAGGYFQSYNTTTADQHGLIGKYIGSNLTNGSGVYGYSKPGDGWGIGGEFEGGWMGAYGRVRPAGGGSSQYWGVFGDATAATPQLNAYLYGVWGSATGANHNYGVYGNASGSTTSNVCSYYGLYGNAFGTGAASANYGLYAEASGGATNTGIFAKGTSYAGYFLGNVAVVGSLSKPGGSFKIDHPLDPANKYLQHSFVESPDMMNIYNGNITLDADGKAIVTMPDWFDALNRDFRYQLTAMGAPGPNLYVAEEVNNNHFSIAGGSAGMKVSWQVTGLRKDVWAEAHRIQVEVPKEQDKVGTYLYPELLGKPESMGENYEMIKQAGEAAKKAEQARGKITTPKASEVKDKK